MLDELVKKEVGQALIFHVIIPAHCTFLVKILLIS